MYYEKSNEYPKGEKDKYIHIHTYIYIYIYTHIYVCMCVYLYIYIYAAKSLQSCPTVRPHRWQPTRLPRPWDSPGKNTGVEYIYIIVGGIEEGELAYVCLKIVSWRKEKNG